MFQNVKTTYVKEMHGEVEDDPRVNFRNVLGSLNNYIGYQRRQDN